MIEEENPTCRRCGSASASKTQKKFNKTRRTLVQHYRCNKCGSHFTAGSWRKFQAPREVIEYVVTLYRRRYRTKDIIERVREKTGVAYSSHTLINWAHRFAPDLKLRRGSGAGLRMLVAAVRRLVANEALAEEMHISPARVEQILSGLADQTKSPRSLKLKRQLRAARHISKEVAKLQGKAERMVRLLEDAKATRDKHPGDFG